MGMKLDLHHRVTHLCFSDYPSFVLALYPVKWFLMWSFFFRAGLFVWWIHRSPLIDPISLKVKLVSCPLVLLSANFPLNRGAQLLLFLCSRAGSEASGFNIFLVQSSLLRDCCLGIWRHRLVTSFVMGSDDFGAYFPNGNYPHDRFFSVTWACPSFANIAVFDMNI